MLWIGRTAIREGHRFIHEGVYRDTTRSNEDVRAEKPDEPALRTKNGRDGGVAPVFDDRRPQ